MRTIRASIALGSLLAGILTCSCGTPTSPATTLSRLSITVTDTSIGSHTTSVPATFFWDGPPAPPPQLQLQAAAVYGDGHQEDVTAQATWQMTIPSVSTISTTGAITVAAFGNMDISATYDGLVGYVAVSVMPCGDLCAQ